LRNGSPASVPPPWDAGFFPIIQSSRQRRNPQVMVGTRFAVDAAPT
jgi:hypothetical protein